MTLMDLALHVLFCCRGKSISPFCDYTNGDGPYSCNLHRTGVSTCNRIVYPAPIPAQYRVRTVID